MKKTTVERMYTAKIAERCNVEFEFGVTRLPHYPVPEGETADSMLRRLCGEGMKKLYPDAKEGDGLVLWRSAHGYILVERRADGIHLVVSDAEGLHERGFAPRAGEGVSLRLASGDGLSVGAYAGKELLGEVSTACVSDAGRHTNFNGLGIGRTERSGK